MNLRPLLETMLETRACDHNQKVGATPREGGVYERGGVRGVETGSRSPSIIRTEPSSGSGSSPAPTVGGVSTVRGPEAIDSPVFAAQRARTRPAGQPSTSSGSPAHATPRGDRPRDTRSAIGTAGPRTHPPYDGDHNHGHGGYGGYYGHHYSYPSYWWGYGAFGLGYFYYDPYTWYPPSYYSGYYGGGAYSGYDYYDDGELRLSVSPRFADVYVDGYFAGRVDDFDGTFQALRLESGAHHIQIVAQGFAPLDFDVRINPGQKITYRGALQPFRP